MKRFGGPMCARNGLIVTVAEIWSSIGTERKNKRAKSPENSQKSQEWLIYTTFMQNFGKRCLNQFC